jgi:hypothetical protein
LSLHRKITTPFRAGDFYSGSFPLCCGLVFLSQQTKSCDMLEPAMARRKITSSSVPSLADELDKIYPGGFNHRDEANALIALAVRNGPIEDLHAGKSSALLKDRSLSRITDKEMKAIMINATKELAKLLRLRDTEPEAYQLKIRAYGGLYCRSWEREK